MKKARQCVVDICENDSVDIRCGGPRKLGFDFQLDPKLSVTEWASLIYEELKKKSFPCQRISITRPRILPGKVWTPLAVKRCIRKYSIS